MSSRSFAFAIGIFFLLLGLSGFVLLDPPHREHPALAVDSFYGQALGLFPVNVLHNLAHIAFGLWGLWAYRSLSNAKTYAKAVAITYIVLTVAGLVPNLETMFGLVPLFGNDIWLHALLASVGGYFAWIHRDTAADARK